MTTMMMRIWEEEEEDGMRIWEEEEDGMRMRRKRKRKLLRKLFT